MSNEKKIQFTIDHRKGEYAASLLESYGFNGQQSIPCKLHFEQTEDFDWRVTLVFPEDEVPEPAIPTDVAVVLGIAERISDIGFTYESFDKVFTEALKAIQKPVNAGKAREEYPINYDMEYPVEKLARSSQQLVSSFATIRGNDGYLKTSSEYSKSALKTRRKLEGNDRLHYLWDEPVLIEFASWDGFWSWKLGLDSNIFVNRSIDSIYDVWLLDCVAIIANQQVFHIRAANRHIDIIEVGNMNRV